MLTLYDIAIIVVTVLVLTMVYRTYREDINKIFAKIKLFTGRGHRYYIEEVLVDRLLLAEKIVDLVFHHRYTWFSDYCECGYRIPGVEPVDKYRHWRYHLEPIVIDMIGYTADKGASMFWSWFVGTLNKVGVRMPRGKKGAERWDAVIEGLLRAKRQWMLEAKIEALEKGNFSIKEVDDARYELGEIYNVYKIQIEKEKNVNNGNGQYDSTVAIDRRDKVEPKD